MEYGALEKEIVNRLNGWFDQNGLNGYYTARVMPENSAEFSRIETVSRVNIAYSGSDYEKPQSTHHIAQIETVAVACYIQSRSIRGEGGIYFFIDRLKECLLGYRPANSRTRMWLSGYGDWKYSDNIIGPYVEFSFSTVATQALDDEPVPLGEHFKHVTTTE